MCTLSGDKASVWVLGWSRSTAALVGAGRSILGRALLCTTSHHADCQGLCYRVLRYAVGLGDRHTADGIKAFSTVCFLMVWLLGRCMDLSMASTKHDAHFSCVASVLADRLSGIGVETFRFFAFAEKQAMATILVRTRSHD